VGNLSTFLIKQFCSLGQLLEFLMLGLGVLGFRGTLAVSVLSSSRVRYSIPF
jgi:hypothetical protein